MAPVEPSARLIGIKGADEPHVTMVNPVLTWCEEPGQMR
jgi:hypothetical protein